MSNLFQDVLGDSKGVQERLLGPPYEYWKQIKTPPEIGMSTEGTLDAMGRDVDGLIQYVEVLVTGGGASKTGGPLGNKFFLPTGGKCKDKDSCKDAKGDCQLQEVDRYIYINNVPQGNIPFISSGMGTNFSELRGLVPGTMGNLNVLNPFAIMQAFMSGSTPDCTAVKLEVVNSDNISSTETHYVSVVDQANMDPCNFLDGKNPINGNQCREIFSNMRNLEPAVFLPDDPMVQAYYAILGVLGLYILYCLMQKANKI
jgi:hypothetical protein